MRKILMVLLGVALGAHAGAYKASLAFAPAIVRGGDLSPDLFSPMQTALSEILSWEASLVPSVKVADPTAMRTALDAKGWSSRTEMDESEQQDARDAARVQNADAALLLKFLHGGPSVDWKVSLVWRAGTMDRVASISGRSREDDFLLDMRKQALGYFDSLGVQVPAAARQIVSERGRVPWEVLLEYAKGIRDQENSKVEDALFHLREASRRAPLLPALKVRLMRLEKENPGK